MRIKYRIGVMPVPWPDGAGGRDFFWRFVELCEKSEIDSVWFSERLSSPLPVPEPMTAMAEPIDHPHRVANIDRGVDDDRPLEGERALLGVQPGREGGQESPATE